MIIRATPQWFYALSQSSHGDWIPGTLRSNQLINVFFSPLIVSPSRFTVLHSSSRFLETHLAIKSNHLTL